MKLKILSEHGCDEAMLGLSLSYNQPVEKMHSVAERLAFKQGGHNKFLESIMLWVEIRAPEYWWKQMDTYRVGITKQSSSIMHRKGEFNQSDFDFEIHFDDCLFYNNLLNDRNYDYLQAIIPMGFIYHRVCCLNYKCLQNIVLQRKNHKLSQWQEFIQQVRDQVKHPQFLFPNENKNQSDIDNSIEIDYIIV